MDCNSIHTSILQSEHKNYWHIQLRVLYPLKNVLRGNKNYSKVSKVQTN